MSKIWLDARQAATQANVALSTIDRLGSAKRVKTKTVNGVLKYSATSLETYMKSRQYSQPSTATTPPVTSNATAQTAPLDDEYVSGRKAYELGRCSSGRLAELARAGRVRTIQGNGPTQYSATDLKQLADNRARFEVENTPNSSWLLRRYVLLKNNITGEELTEICSRYQVRTKSASRPGWSLYYQPDMEEAVKKFRAHEAVSGATPTMPATQHTSTPIAAQPDVDNTAANPAPTSDAPLRIVAQALAISKQDLPAKAKKDSWEYAAWLTRSVVDGYLPVDMAETLANKRS